MMGEGVRTLDWVKKSFPEEVMSALKPECEASHLRI